MLARAEELDPIKAGRPDPLKPDSGEPVVREEVSRQNFFHAVRSIAGERQQIAYRIVPSSVDSVMSRPGWQFCKPSRNLRLRRHSKTPGPARRIRDRSSRYARYWRVRASICA